MLFGLIRHCYKITIMRNDDRGTVYSSAVARCQKKITTAADLDELTLKYLEKNNHPKEGAIVLSINYLGLDWSIREGD